MILLHEGNKGNTYLSGGVVYKTGPIMKEYKILSNLNHPNIIKVLGLATIVERGIESTCMAMEYFDGDWLARPCISEVEQLKDAVEYIHSKGIKHNDLMAYNVLTNGETIKIIDFGNASPISFHASEVEGCKREDWEMVEEFKGEMICI